MAEKRIGIKLADGEFYPILPENRPARKRLIVTTVKDDQASVQIDLYRGEAARVTGDDYIVMAGYPGAISFAEQIVKVEAYRPESAFSDAMKGLHLYGAKLVRPTGIATLTASIT